MCVVDVVPPTVFLPPLKLLKECSDQEISRAIESLRYIYLPEVRGSSRRHKPHADAAHDIHSHLTLDSHSKKLGKWNANLSEIRADPFERTFAIQWLTRFVSLFSEDIDSPGFLAVSSQTLEEAASLLAICAGSAASGTVTRTFTFPFQGGVSTVTCDSPSSPDRELNRISVILRDAPLESSDFSSVGAQTWGGSCVLAEMIAENPRYFSICSMEGVEPSPLGAHANAPFRALELGAGTGLASLVLGKVLGRMRDLEYLPQERGSSKIPQATENVDTVIATDFHPSVIANLQLNFAVNFPSQINSQMHVDDDTIQRHPRTRNLVPNMVVLPLDWSVIHSLVQAISTPRVEPPFWTPEIRNNETHQISTPGEDRPDLCPCHAFDVDTSFQSQIETEQQQAQITYDQQQFSSNDKVQSAGGLPRVPPELDDPFDLIIGADIIYEHSHARWIHSCIERFLRKPRKHYGPRDPMPSLTDQHSRAALFHLVIPLRHTHAAECHSVEKVFPQAKDIILSRQISQNLVKPPKSSDTFRTGDYTGITRHPDETVSFSDTSMAAVPLELAIMNQEDIWCDAYSDREEDVVYRYYRIGWV